MRSDPTKHEKDVKISHNMLESTIIESWSASVRSFYLIFSQPTMCDGYMYLRSLRLRKRITQLIFGTQQTPTRAKKAPERGFHSPRYTLALLPVLIC